MTRFGRLKLNESEIIIVTASEEETDRTYDEVMSTVDDLSNPDNDVDIYSNQATDDFDISSLIRGTIEELEHTSNLDDAIKLAMHYLTCDPNHYNKLETIQEEIKKVGSKWAVYPKKPKKGQKRRKALGTHSSRAGALKQLRAIEISKAGR